jgi:putative oxidoreductase
MSEQPTSIVPGAGSGGTVELERPRRRPLEWHRGADLGLVLLRFAVGGVFFGHGMQKVFGLWGGPGIAGFERTLVAYGYQQPRTLAWVTGIGELVAGACVVLGVVTPLAAAGLVALTVNTVLLKAGNGFFVAGPAGAGAVELDVVLGLAAAAITLIGPGRVALDDGRPWHRRPASWGTVALVLGITAGLLVFFLLRA